MSFFPTVPAPPAMPAPGPAYDPASQRRQRSTLVPLALAALVGGGVAALGVAALADGGGSSAAPASALASAPVAVPISASAAASGATTESIAAIYKQDAPGVVRITRGNGEGSGFSIDRDGHILTNAHVVDATGPITVSFSNGDRVDAQLVGTDPSTDVALLKVNEPADALHPIPLGSSASLQVGDPVVAIGNPFGLDRTITSGIVSAVARQIQSPNGFPINNAIQTDAAINHGNSGGPMLNMQGEVVGINSQIADSGVNANVGVGFAIPIDLVKSIEHDLQAHGSVQHAYLGVALSDVDSALAASQPNLPVKSGAMVAKVTPDSPAAAAGLQGGSNQVVLGGQTYVLGGDIVTAIDGQAVTSGTDLQSAIQQHRAGDVVTLSVVHNDGSKSAVKITLGQQPASPATQSQQSDPQQQAPQQVDPSQVPQQVDPSQVPQQVDPSQVPQVDPQQGQQPQQSDPFGYPLP